MTRLVWVIPSRPHKNGEFSVIADLFVYQLIIWFIKPFFKIIHKNYSVVYYQNELWKSRRDCQEWTSQRHRQQLATRHGQKINNCHFIEWRPGQHCDVICNNIVGMLINFVQFSEPSYNFYFRVQKARIIWHLKVNKIFSCFT